MVGNEIPVLTKEQARFLLDFELDTYAKKAKTIAAAARTLKFENSWDEENFYEAIRQGFWDVQTDIYFINVLAPLGRVGFITEVDNTYDITDDFTKAKPFTINDLDKLTSDTILATYNKAEFLVSEYNVVFKYGDIVSWLKSDNADGNNQGVVEVSVVKGGEHPKTMKKTETDEMIKQGSTNLKHGTAVISLK